MNVNPNKVKDLIANFTDLTDEMQDKLIATSYKLLFEQSAKKDIDNKNVEFSTKKQYQQEIESLASNNLSKALDILDFLKTKNDTEKAAFFMLLKSFQEKNTYIDDSEISIVVNEKQLTTRQFLEKTLNNVDIPKAREISERIRCEIISDLKAKQCNEGKGENNVMICQKCGNEFTERPAKSRIDNSPICSLCGQKEALDAAVEAGAMSQEVANGILEALKNKSNQ